MEIKKMTYTLISCVGTGMFFNEKTKEKEYRETTYKFPNGEEKTTKLFLEALISSNYRKIGQIILIGTKTSNWGALIKEADCNKSDEVLDLYSRLYDNDKNELGIDNNDIPLLEKYLEQRFSVPVIIRAPALSIDEDSSEKLFTLYNALSDKINSQNNILFDITHSFRSIPLLVYQALNFSFGNANINKTVELVYGEFVPSKKISYVRNLSKYWKFSQITDAVSIFINKLDGFKLAVLIEDKWKDGARVVKRISEIVQTNFSLQVFDIFKQIKNILAKEPPSDEVWVKTIIDFFKEIYSLYDKDSHSKTLYNYSKFLYKHNLNVQAIIALQITVEACIVEKYSDVQTYLGDWDWWQECGKGELSNTLHKLDWKTIGEPLLKLEYFRNQIAHGGGRDKKTKEFPSVSNIKGIYERGEKGVKKLFEYIS